MANSSRITRASLPRVLQLGLDKIIDQNGKEYRGPGDEIFEEIKTEKGYYEMMQMAGMGVAAQKGEGDSITWDSIDQTWVFRVPVWTYEKSARITREMIKDNLYEDMLPRIGREQLKALSHARDINQASILNNAFSGSYTYGDGSSLCSTTHATQAGPTNSNQAAVNQDLSEAAIETAVQGIDNFINDDGLKSDYYAKRLIVPVALRFEAKRLLKNPMRPETADRDISVLNMEGDISDIKVWKRLSSSVAWFLQTDADQGLITIRREGIYSEAGQDFDTYDTKLTMAERYAVSVGDHRGVFGNVGV